MYIYIYVHTHPYIWLQQGEKETYKHADICVPKFFCILYVFCLKPQSMQQKKQTVPTRLAVLRLSTYNKKLRSSL